MKKILTLIAMVCFLLLLKTSNSYGQLPGITLIAAGDSSWNSSCSVPDTRDLYFYGTAYGYVAGDSVDVEVSFGDGTDTLVKSPIFAGNAYFSGMINHIYYLPGAYSIQFIATGPDGSTDTLVDANVLVATQCNDITGKIYIDNNSDCIFNAGDVPVSWTYVNASYNGVGIAYAGTDGNGDYSISVPDGFTYSVAPYLSGFTIICPNSGQYAISTLPSSGNDFSVSCNAQVDLKSEIYGQGFRNNSSTTISLNAYNILATCAGPNATVTVTLDPLLSYVSSSVTPISVTGSQIVFNAGQLSGYFSGNGGNFYSSLTVLTDISASLGDTLCVSMTVDPVLGDVNPADNTITVCMPVRNSCDPNEKYEAHVGAGSGNVAPGTTLDYTILFQNVGNDDAYDISVIDEIDANLDMATFKLTGYSFQPTSITTTGNTMKFDMKNINLPALSVNEPLSHGFISYSISPKANTALGTSILNTAKIYFDFNAPIITNTVTDIIANAVGLNSIDGKNAINIYPNPAADYFTVRTRSKAVSVFTIYDVTGRTVLSTQNISDNQSISTKGLSSGAYFVTLVTDGITHTGKLLVK